MKMTFTQKLSMIIAILVIVSGSIAYFGIKGAGSINDSLNNLVDNEARKVYLSGKVQQNIIEMQRSEKNMILASTQEDMDHYEKNFNNANTELNKFREELRGLATDSNKAILDTFKLKYESYVEVFRKITELTRENSNIRAKELLNTDAKTYIVKVDKLTDDIKVNIAKELEKKLDKNSKARLQSLMIISSIESNILKSVRDAGRSIIETDEKKMNIYVASSNKFLQEAYKDTDKLAKVIAADQRSLLEQAITALSNYDEVQSKILALTQQNSLTNKSENFS